MKKVFLLLASAAMLLVSCQQDQVSDNDGELVTVSYSAQVANDVVTKALADNDGNGIYATRCIMELYYADELYYRATAPVSGKTATFDNVTLVSNRTYEVLFWADAGDKYYDASDLKAVKMKAVKYAANDDKRDAFFHRGQQKVAQKGKAYSVQLRRPFAQVNVITLDAASVKNEALYPETVEMVYTAPTQFNIYTGELSEEKKLTVAGDVYAAFDADKSALTLEMDYLFADTEKAALDIAFKAKHADEDDVVYSFTNIPYQRNYRTNIQGNLLTTNGNWTATLIPEWYGNGTSDVDDHLIEYVEAGSIAAANEAFASGATSVKITSVGNEKTLYLPQTAEEVTIDFANPSETVTVKYGPAPTPTKAGGVNPAAVNIATNDITKFTVTGINNIVWLAGNQDVLANALTNAAANQTVALANDIMMSGEWKPVTTKGCTVDGRNHVISNMTINDCGLDYAALIGYMPGGVVKNITVMDAEIVYSSNAQKKARGAAVVGVSYGGTIENCHADNVSIKGYQKMGGIVGYLAQSGNGFVVRNCSAKDITFTNNTTDPTYQAGGIIGYTLNYNGDILVEGCSVSDITINNLFNGIGTEDENTPYYCGTFIGSLDNQAEKEGLKIELKNNTISGTKNTPQISHIYADTYFGWANNNERTSEGKKAYLATILIDGQEWTPNYPYQIVDTGAKYSTLDKALAAATDGQTVQILKAGEYKFPSTQKAITVEGLNEKDEDENYVVAFDLRTASGGNKNVKFKHLTFNLLQKEDPDRGFTGCENLTYNECVFTGEYWGYDSGMSTFNNCVFHDATNYSIWTYGGNITLNSCEFFSDHGKFVNVYATGSTVHTIYANNCVFHNTGDAKKAAFNLKGLNTHGSVVMTNCSVTGNFPNSSKVDGQAIFSDSGLYMFDDPEWSDDVYAVVDGVTYYPYFIIDADGNYSVNNATGLHKAIDHYNALTTAVERTITVADGTYEVSDLLVKQNVKNKSVKIMAANKYQAIMKINSDSKTRIFFLIDGGNNKDNPEYVKIDGFDFQVPTNPGTKENDETYIVYGLGSGDTIGKNLNPDYNSKYYAHNVTLSNCKVLGFNTQYISVMKCPNKSSNKNATVDNCIIDKVGYVINGYFDQAFVKYSTVTNTKVLANINTFGISVENCNVSTYHDYCIRTNGGPVVVKNNTFDITWNSTTDDVPAVVYLKTNNNSAVATITGNTFTKANASMFDLYCAHDWTVNSEIKVASSKINF